MMRFKTCLTSVAALLLASQSAQGALIILGNLSQTNDGLGATVDAGTDDVGSNFTHVRHAVSFTMPAQSYAVQQVSLRLSDYSTSAGDVAAVGFYEDNGADAPGLLVGNILNSPLRAAAVLPSSRSRHRGR
jgi:hypothetical protein